MNRDNILRSIEELEVTISGRMHENEGRDLYTQLSCLQSCLKAAKWIVANPHSSDEAIQLTQAIVALADSYHLLHWDISVERIAAKKEKEKAAEERANRGFLCRLIGC